MHDPFKDRGAGQPLPGLLGLLGLRIIMADPGLVIGELAVRPELLNSAGTVHGGVLCSMIDFAACSVGRYSAGKTAPRPAATLSLTTHFNRPARDGLLRVEGTLLSAGRRIYSAEARVLDATGVLIAHGIGSFRWQDSP